ncbi:MAG: hypothetical protein KJO07_07015, partial [Deltaproteobacteria bacterium]|nr:hypothetical protein [Deltaproteobacteria bacterium]
MAQPDAPSVSPQCEVSTDCSEAVGEICDEGICWGGPPAGTTFAAVLSPPEDRPDLAVTEIPAVPIADDGTIEVFQFGDSVVVSGRVVLACVGESEPLGCGPERSVAARVTFERDSRIPGGPRFKRSVQAAADVGTDDEPAFSVRLPTLVGDERYLVTIVPESADSVEGQFVDPAAVAPPARVTLDPESETEDLMLTVGSQAGLKPIAGVIRTEFSEPGEGLAGMQVFARGRWTDDGPLVRASNVVTTGDDGSFELLVPLAMEDTFDLVARPTGEIVA